MKIQMFLFVFAVIVITGCSSSNIVDVSNYSYTCYTGYLDINDSCYNDNQWEISIFSTKSSVIQVLIKPNNSSWITPYYGINSDFSVVYILREGAGNILTGKCEYLITIINKE